MTKFDFKQFPGMYFKHADAGNFYSRKTGPERT